MNSKSGEKMGYNEMAKKLASFCFFFLLLSLAVAESESEHYALKTVTISIGDQTESESYTAMHITLQDIAQTSFSSESYAGSIGFASVSTDPTPLRGGRVTFEEPGLVPAMVVERPTPAPETGVVPPMEEVSNLMFWGVILLVVHLAWKNERKKHFEQY